MTQYEAVAQALEQLGGVATLAQLYHQVPKIPGCAWKTKTPNASIRRIVQLHKGIFKIKPGLYGLLSMKPAIESRGIIQETAKNKGSQDLQQSNHSYYQGLLLTVGRLRQHQCWAPNQDRNKAFLGGTIGTARTLDDLPSFSYPDLVKRCATVDVIWFNQRRMPASLFEVEYSTDIQNSLLKFCDLQDFHTRMVIVAERLRHPEFRAKLSYSAFADIRDRVSFLDFTSLVKQYEHIAAQAQTEVAL